MKESPHKPKCVLTLLKSKKGFSLIEGLVSIVVFAAMVATITTAMMFAFNIVRRANEAAKNMQTEANVALSDSSEVFSDEQDGSDFPFSSEDKYINFSGGGYGIGLNTSISVKMRKMETSRFVAFNPLP